MKTTFLMLSRLALLGAVCLFPSSSLITPLLSAEDPARESAPRKIERPEDLDLPTVLERINVGPYDRPDLPLKTNRNYAHASADVQPFGGVKPFKEHFLVQMEYNGPGRGIPEPEQVDTVKIGFLGPIMPTVSVATGGKSYE